MIMIKLGAKDKNYLHFKDYAGAVNFMRSQMLPWKECTKNSNPLEYKRGVARRAKIMYGDEVKIRILSDKEFIHDLYQLGEIEELIDSTLQVNIQSEISQTSSDTLHIIG